MDNLPMSRAALYRIVKDFRDGILDGDPPEDYCYMVSDPLGSFLETQGVINWLQPGAVFSPHAKVCLPVKSGIYTHYWLRLESGTIIDATASQFRRPCGRRMPEVYIGPKPEWYFQDDSDLAAGYRQQLNNPTSHPNHEETNQRSQSGSPRCQNQLSQKNGEGAYGFG